MVVADYQDDFNLTTDPAARNGWSYHWNANGPLGNPANYVPLAVENGQYEPAGTPAAAGSLGIGSAAVDPVKFPQNPPPNPFVPGLFLPPLPNTYVRPGLGFTQDAGGVESPGSSPTRSPPRTSPPRRTAARPPTRSSPTTTSPSPPPRPTRCPHACTRATRRRRSSSSSPKASRFRRNWTRTPSPWDLRRGRVGLHCDRRGGERSDRRDAARPDAHARPRAGRPLDPRARRRRRSCRPPATPARLTREQRRRQSSLPYQGFPTRDPCGDLKPFGSEASSPRRRAASRRRVLLGERRDKSSRTSAAGSRGGSVRCTGPRWRTAAPRRGRRGSRSWRSSARPA